ncbi:MAG: hypothetical protein DMF41_02910 [Verrucomicrobia bacterium]|nr:MAG: hypothetical protein DME62_00515 [Verrucomicrobiota bacterium]PYL21341.1 MAG: hypothetical protein DMF41_02910 [Verrucomicrobiota bacterium]
MRMPACIHIDVITSIRQPQCRECEECVTVGAYWVHLRTCQQTRHTTGHPVISSAQPGEGWLYCYPDDAFAEY